MGCGLVYGLAGFVSRVLGFIPWFLSSSSFKAKITTILLTLVVLLGIMSGCSKTGSEVVKKNPDSVALTAEINAVKLSKVSSNISTALTTENCTIRQYAAKKVKSERFFCKIEGVNQLLLYAKPNQNSIAWMDSKEQVYVFNLHDVNTQLVVNGRVKVNNSSWEFVPQNNRFLIGPKRVEVVLDQSTH